MKRVETVHSQSGIGALKETIGKFARSRRIQQLLRIVPLELGQRGHANTDFCKTGGQLGEQTESGEPRRRDIVLDELAEGDVHGVLVLHIKAQLNEAKPKLRRDNLVTKLMNTNNSEAEKNLTAEDASRRTLDTYPLI